jgi:mannose-1-phosphate guanylyltransferase
MSRQSRPKQLLALGGERTLLQQTIDRVLPLVPGEHIYILTGHDHAPLIADQLVGVPRDNILLEYSPRGTGPCLGLAAMRLRASHPGDAVMISLHADHLVQDEPAFRRALAAAIATAREGHLVTIGIVPDRPDTGFGYIERSAALPAAEGQPVYTVSRFTEKPPLADAECYVASGRYYWNTGYFAWTLERILGEFAASLPATYERLGRIVAAGEAPEAQAEWELIERVTIDVGIMEQAADVAVVPADMGWSDVGSWSALYDILPLDRAGQVVMAQTQHIGLDSSGCLVSAPGKLVTTIGVDDLVIVDTGDALLVLPRKRAQDVGALVKELRARGLTRYL